MDRRAAIAALPHPYAVALRLDEGGASADAIACALDIEPVSVAMVLRLGRAKLAAVLAAAPRNSGTGAAGGGRGSSAARRPPERSPAP